MATWSTRRQFKYAAGVISVLVLFVAVPAFMYFYEAPTCFDGKLNGSELGIDCGGKCARLCQSAFLPPIIQWGGAKIEKVAEGQYNVGAYIVNPNINGAALDVPYKMSLYDAEGILITEREGKITLYPHRNSLAFQTAVNTAKRIPTKAIFEFTSPPVWFKSNDNLGGIAVVDRKYEDSENSSFLEVTLENRTLFPYQNVEVAVVLYDSNGNVIGFSRTMIDSIKPKNGREIAPYTWPFSRNGRVATVEVIPSIKPTAAR